MALLCFDPIRAKPVQKVILSRKSALRTLVFIRAHLDNGDLLYDQYSNIIFSSKTESGPYNVALAITGALRGSSREKLYQDLSEHHQNIASTSKALDYLFMLVLKSPLKYSPTIYP